MFINKYKKSIYIQPKSLSLKPEFYRTLARQVFGAVFVELEVDIVILLFLVLREIKGVSTEKLALSLFYLVIHFHLQTKALLADQLEFL